MKKQQQYYKNLNKPGECFPRDSNLIRSHEITPNSNLKKNPASRSYSRKNSHTIHHEPPAQCDKVTLANNYFTNNYNNDPTKYRSQSMQGKADPHTGYPRPATGLKNIIQPLDPSPTNSDEKDAVPLQAKNVNISSDNMQQYLNNTISIDIDLMQQKAHKKLGAYQSKQQHDKFERLKNLYIRSGAKSSQNKYQYSTSTADKKSQNYSFYVKNMPFLQNKVVNSHTNNFMGG